MYVIIIIIIIVILIIIIIITTTIITITTTTTTTTTTGLCLACGMIKKYSDTQAEIACLAVHPAYRRSGRGETMLSYLEREAIKLGVSEIFVLSTRTMQW